jgi:hypothetical protein
MRLLILIATAISLAGCAANQQTAGVNYCVRDVAPGTPPAYVVRDQDGCVLGVDPDPRVRSQIRRDRGQGNGE